MEYFFNEERYKRELELFYKRKERKEKIVKMREDEGYSYRKIAYIFGVCDTRIEQIYKTDLKEPKKEDFMCNPLIIPKTEADQKYSAELRKRLKELSIKKVGGRERTREIVRFRDGYTCQTCGTLRTPEMAKKKNKYQLDVHHLGGLCGQLSRKYDKVDTLDSMITLCHKCHYNHPEHTRNRNKKLPTPPPLV